MDQQAAIALVTIAAFVGLAATGLTLLRRTRRSRPPDESPFAASTEGMTTCYRCGRANFPTDADCLYCGSSLPPHQDMG
jgi:hypothetical protein